MINRNEKIKEGKSWMYCGSCVIIISTIIIIGGMTSILDSPSYWAQFFLPSFGLIFPILIIGFVSFLYGIKKVTSLRIFRQKKRDLLILYCSSCSFLISITLVIYGYGSSTWCRLFPYSRFDCHFRFTGLSQVIIYSGISLFFISTFLIIYGLYQIRKISLKKGVVEEIEEKKDTPAKIVYKIRKERASNESGVIYHICGNCGERNRFTCIDKDLNLYQCKKCKVENYLD